MSDERVRVAVLWQEVTGYVMACLSALAATQGTRVLVTHRRPASDNPFVLDPAAHGIESHRHESTPDAGVLINTLEAFKPHALLVSSWHIPAYRRALRRFAGRTIRLLAMDNPWLGTARQWLGVAVAPLFIRPLYEGVFLAGERQAVFARKLGFRHREVLYGVCVADVDSIVAGVANAAPAARAFLFIGRLEVTKGVDVLAAAYAAYRAAVPDPWALRICGLGPLQDRLAGQPGVSLRGFVQPAALPAELASASCLILPSRFEAWGVVIHEAAAAGLPVICTPDCGASVSLVRDGYNGYLVEAGSTDDLARNLIRLHRLGAEARAAMSIASRGLAAQYTPGRWAHDLLERIAEMRAAAPP